MKTLVSINAHYCVNIFLTECDLPQIPEFGSYIISPDSTDLTFSCGTGYSLQGSRELRCSNDGTGYNASLPECGMII